MLHRVTDGDAKPSWSSYHIESVRDSKVAHKFE